MKNSPKKGQNTSWGGVADWYDKYMEEGEDTYQKAVILPNLLRLMGIRAGDVVLDVACGQGYFSREFVAAGATVVGSDISPELIRLAREKTPDGIKYIEAPANNMRFLKSASFDVVALILGLQNIENMEGVFAECSRLLKRGGRMFVVLNHPVFRAPKATSWAYDDVARVQYRRIDAYMSESKKEIEMHPGKKEKKQTYSFHRPLQSYLKSMSKNNFCVSQLEEWVSHKLSDSGPRAPAENKARKEIPLFMCIEATKK